jgi:hypothetical protein
MINKTIIPLATAFLLLAQISQADDLLDMLNAEANEDASASEKKNDARIMDKIVAKNSSFIPKNKNEFEYRKHLKNKFHKTYLQYIKLSSIAQKSVYEQYAEKSFPRIEDTKKAIIQLLN